MKICFIGSKDNSVNIFGDLIKVLSKKILGLESEQRFVSFAEDIPIVALESAEESDFLVVLAFLEDEEEVKFVKRKLVDVELSTKTRILKRLETDEFSGLDEEEYNERKDELVEELAGQIIGILFNEKSFEPKDKDFSI